MNTRRKPNNLKVHTEIEEQPAPPTSEQDSERIEAGQVVNSETEFIIEHTEKKQPEPTWIWDRNKQTWVEIMAEPAEVEPTDDTVESPHRGPAIRVMDAITSKARLLKTLASQANGRKASGMEIVTTVAEAYSKGKRDKSNQILIQDAETQAEKIIALAEARAKARAENIIAQAEQRAEERVESIIVKAEETALAKAINIIIAAEERAEALAEHIIAKAEELAQAKTQYLIAQTGEKVQKQSKSIIANSEEQAENIVVSTKEMQQQIVTAAKHQAERMPRASDNELKEIKADIVKETKTVPRQTEHFVQEGEIDEGTIPSRGTAELVIEPPVNYGIVRTVLKRIAVLRDIKISGVGGSREEGVRIKLSSQNLERLPFRIGAIPEIEKVSNLPQKSSRVYPLHRILPGQKKGNGHIDIRYLIKIGE
jgi:vacuolar-type H+-ATPase subunit H